MSEPSNWKKRIENRSEVWKHVLEMIIL